MFLSSLYTYVFFFISLLFIFLCFFFVFYIFIFFFFFFFFQAEDGIRDADVTGVQTCALPISTVKKADKIIVMDSGKIMEEGTHQELLQIENGFYRNLYEVQFVKEEAI